MNTLGKNKHIVEPMPDARTLHHTGMRCDAPGEDTPTYFYARMPECTQHEDIAAASNTADRIDPYLHTILTWHIGY